MYRFLSNKEIKKPSSDSFFLAGPEFSCYSKGSPGDTKQSYHLRNGSRRLTSRRRSNSFSACPLPSIPEYPGFQDVKISPNNCRISDMKQGFLAIGRKENSSKMDKSHYQLTLAHDTSCTLGLRSTRSPQNTNGDFVDQSLEDYFSQRLTALRNYKAKGSNMKAQGETEASFQPSPHFRTLRRRSSCGPELLTRQVKEPTKPYITEAQPPHLPLSLDPQESQGELAFCSKSNYLDILILNASTPIQSVQKVNIRP